MPTNPEVWSALSRLTVHGLTAPERLRIDKAYIEDHHSETALALKSLGVTSLETACIADLPRINELLVPATPVFTKPTTVYFLGTPRAGKSELLKSLTKIYPSIPSISDQVEDIHQIQRRRNPLSILPTNIEAEQAKLITMHIEENLLPRLSPTTFVERGFTDVIIWQNIHTILGNQRPRADHANIDSMPGLAFIFLITNAETSLIRGSRTSPRLLDTILSQYLRFHDQVLKQQHRSNFYALIDASGKPETTLQITLQTLRQIGINQ